MMHMTFYWGKDVTILFDFWRVRTWPWYLASLLALAVAAALTEWLASTPSAPTAHAEKEEPAPAWEEDGGDRRAPLISRACPQRRSAAQVGVLFGVRTAIGYLLMLAAMSFNGGVFVAIVVGFAVGHSLFRSEEGGRGKSACGSC